MTSRFHPAAEYFMRTVYPYLSEEGQKKIDAVFREYGIGGRDLTTEEVAQAGDMVVEIVRKYHIHPLP